jgi:HD-GYP domain-containing protein (c-di-GMP phosphodiesterase class II)
MPFINPISPESIIEVASTLASELGASVSVFKRSGSDWNQIRVRENAQLNDFQLRERLEGLNLHCDIPVIYRDGDQMTIVVNPDIKSYNTTLISLTLASQQEKVLCALIITRIEAIRYRDELADANKQAEGFIGQITQDFEELSWFRNANDYMDLSGPKHSTESIAIKCLPDLASVIRAEAILFIPTQKDTDLSIALPDFDRVVIAGSLELDKLIYTNFLHDSITHLTNGPRIVNVKPNDHSLEGFPGLRNTIVITISKESRIYGWLLAINKIAVACDNASDNAELHGFNTTSFGTFEAGLLVAAANIMASHSKNRELFDEQETLLIGIVRALINAIDAKDPYTCGHSDRVASYAKVIASRIGLKSEECERIYMAGLLHDIGKIGVPDSILGKPGKLTDEEFAIVKKHPEIGHAILKHLKQLDYVLPGVMHHHEAINGHGYPAGLVGESIPLSARILAVADAYDAMTSDRPYRSGMPSEKAESILRAESNKTWDSDIVNAFLECIEQDEIRPHSIAVPNAIDEGDLNNTSSSSLMRRIGLSINNMVVG